MNEKIINELIKVLKNMNNEIKQNNELIKELKPKKKAKKEK